MTVAECDLKAINEGMLNAELAKFYYLAVKKVKDGRLRKHLSSFLSAKSIKCGVGKA